MSENKYPEEIKNLPVYSHLDGICEALKASESHFLVLTAETAAGKSTAVPLALLNHFEHNILMLEPRRLAVLNIAERVSSLLGEKPGNTCGYVMHLENKVTDSTRFTVLTEAILTRKLQSDPALTGTDAVIIDEFHERSVHADLALALLKEAVQLRDDLYVIVMSATIETTRLSRFLGTDEKPAPVYKVPGRQFPVKRYYAGDIPVSKAVLNVLRGTDYKDDPEDYKADNSFKGTDIANGNRNSTVKTGNKGTDWGTVLVFLPGISDIRRVQKELEAMGTDAEVLVLHSSVPFEQQKKVLKGGTEGKRRVILSSAIAETSLTIPDVTVVIDSGLSRLNVFNQNALMNQLVTRRESQFNADQRAGRAGRIQAGKCICLWNKNDVRTADNVPEILRTDLSTLVLECYEWGVTDLKGLQWLDSPSAASWNSAVQILQLLNCIKDNRITALGKACLSLGVDLRLACVALSGIPYGKEELSTAIAVKFMDNAKGTDYLRNLYEKDLLLRVQKAKKQHSLDTVFPQTFKEFSTGFALLCGFPDRLGVKASGNSGGKGESTYQFMSGRAASLKETEAGGKLPEYIIGINLDAGEGTGRIYEYEALDKEIAEEFLNSRVQIKYRTEFEGDSYRLRKKECVCYGRIVLKEKPCAVEDGDFIEALSLRVEEKGIEALPLGKKSRDFLKRVRFYVIYGEKSEKKGTDPESDGDSLGYRLENLAVNVKEWLGPFITPGQNSVTEDMVYNGLFWYFDGDRINKSVPVEILLPNGKKRKLVYEEKGTDIVPVLEIIIQQIFGCFETPEVCGKPVLLKLLSPARRPLQITSDLENFWKETWPEICSEMKGRYPKHNWDYRVVEKDVD